MTKPQSKKTIYLIDASSLFFRAFYALPAMNTSSGLPTQAIYGFLKSILKILKFKDKYIVLCFDTKEGSFRNELYPDYKGNRGEIDPDLEVQIPYIQKVVETLGVYSLQKKGYEADDIIGTLAKQFSKANHSVAVVSNDKDFVQLIDKNIFLYDIQKNIKYNEQKAVQKWGVPPSQMLDYLSLVGDSSDNVPGVKGIGPKGAIKLLQTYKNLKDIYKNINKIEPESIRKKLLESKDNAFLSQKLIQIDIQAVDKLDIQKTRFSFSEKKHFLSFLQELEFKTLRKEFEKLFKKESLASSKVFTDHKSQKNPSTEIQKDSEKKPQNGVHVQDSIENQKSFIQKTSSLQKNIQETLPFCMESEEVSQKKFSDYLLNDENQPIFSYKDVQRLKEYQFHDHCDVSKILKKIKKKSEILLFEEKDEVFLLYENDIFCLKELCKNHPIDQDLTQKTSAKVSQKKSLSADLFVGLLDKEVIWNGFDLKNIWSRLDPLRAIHFGNIKKTDHSFCVSDFSIGIDIQLSFHLLRSKNISDLSKVFKSFFYISSDVENILQKALLCTLSIDILKKRMKEAKVDNVYYDLERWLVPILFFMEHKGVLISEDELNLQKKHLSSILNRTKKNIFKDANEEFNILSPKQLGGILFDKLKFPQRHKTAKGDKSTAVEALEGLKDHSIVKNVLKYRELSKLQSTYIEGIIKLLDSESRVHTCFNQSLTTTGRLSSSHPNLQNIPIRTEEGRKIRKAFVAPRNCLLLSADYSQIDLRVLAHVSDDKNLKKAFDNDEDIHAFTASEVFKVKLKEVTREQRQRAKAVNFGLVYGQGAQGLSQSLGVSRSEAMEIIEKYFTQFKGIKDYMERIVEQAKSLGFVVTLLGRRRYIDELKSKSVRIQKFGERISINTPIQGGASDIVKLAMIELSKKMLQRKEKGASLLLQVHDEILMESLKKEAQENLDILVKVMESVEGLSVPLKVHASMNASWFDMGK